MTTPNPGELYQSGKLAEAVTAALNDVKHHPSDTGKRWLLCELLCFAGELSRAERHLETLATQDPKSMFSVTVFRNLIRAESARREFFAEGKVPEILGELTPSLRLYLEAAEAIRKEACSDAMQILSEAEQQRSCRSGVCDGEAFADLRDTDDLTAAVFEAFTVAGGYCWIPMEHVQSVEFGAKNRMSDLLWRLTHLVLSNGFDGQMYLPALYYNTYYAGDEQLLLGRGTDWSGGDGSPVRGIGQRVLLVGDEGRPMLEISSIRFE